MSDYTIYVPMLVAALMLLSVIRQMGVARTTRHRKDTDS